ncbi:MAG TPA: septal ring lytic transglycosylase RlpA family protein [Xanthobacteraceae bacterium]|jgi:rare lipoprotein A
MIVSRLTIAMLAMAIACGVETPHALAGDSKARAFSGMAAYYSRSGRVAEGGRFDPTLLTCAHRTLPFGTRVRVTDPKSGRSVIVTVNDRGPFNKGRVIDVSLAAARVLGMIGRGIIYVRAEVL